MSHTPTSAPHIPVMIDQVLSGLSPRDGETYVDATFGAGGYTKAILEHADCELIAIDRDPSAQKRADEIDTDFGKRFQFKRGKFSQSFDLVRSTGTNEVDGFVMDVGVSSMQIDQPDRGFSFQKDGPLDMRMDYESGEETAADVVNNYDEDDLIKILREYGEERQARKIVRLILKRRAESPFETTKELADLIQEHTPYKHREKIHPATRTFQALRIHVNDELAELNAALIAAENLLHEGGRLVVVSFHSLEDSIVKKFMRERSQNTAQTSRHLPPTPEATLHSFTLPQKKAYFPTDDETQANPRARSARMRVAIRTSAPAYSEQRGAA